MNKYERTISLLTDLKDAGYQIITVGKPHINNPACAGWLDGPTSIWGYHETFDGFYNSNEHPNVCRDGSWPAVWDITRRHTNESLCGNGHQKQIDSNGNSFVHGTYSLEDLEEVKKNLTSLEQEEFIDTI